MKYLNIGVTIEIYFENEFEANKIFDSIFKQTTT